MRFVGIFERVYCMGRFWGRRTGVQPPKLAVIGYFRKSKLLPKVHHVRAFKWKNTLCLVTVAVTETDEDGDWTVWITAGERTTGAFADEVLIVIYGENGKTDEMRLANGQPCEDQLDSDHQYEVKLLNICAIYSALNYVNLFDAVQ